MIKWGSHSLSPLSLHPSNPPIYSRLQLTKVWLTGIPVSLTTIQFYNYRQYFLKHLQICKIRIDFDYVDCYVALVLTK